MEVIPYKGYVLKAAPYQLADTGEWTTRVVICRDAGDSTIEKPFSAGNTFETREKAIAHSLNFGQQIVDGEHEGMELP